MRHAPRRSPRAFRRTALSHALLLACASLSLPALADDECGAATPGGQAVCEPAGPDPLPQVRYTGVSDFNLVLRSGVVVDGTTMPEGDTAVVVYGSGAIGLHAEDGTVIRSYDAWPAVDVVSSSGPVDVRVDQVYGGFVGVSALAEGDVTVWANHVEGATAIEAISLGGNVLVDVASVQAGAYGTGVLALAEQGDVRVLAGQALAQGDFSAGIDASSFNGSVEIHAGYVAADGYGSRAIQAVSWEGGDVSVDVDTAVTWGEGSAAIIAAAGWGDVSVRADWVSTMGQYGIGVGVFAFEGSIDAEINGVGTDGDYTRGIDLQALGSVRLVNGSVFTTGAFADAVNVETVGQVAIGSERITTYGDDAYGIRVLTGGDVAIEVAEIQTYGARSSALFVGTDTGDVYARVGSVHARDTTDPWFAIGLSSNSGDVALVVDELVRSDAGTAITLGAHVGRAQVLVAAGATVHGEITAIDALAGDTSRIDVAGTVTSGRGPVIQVQANHLGDGHADIRIAGTGSVQGWLGLTDNDDVVANAGRFLSAGTNLFGAGDDRFLNLGTIGLLDGGGTLEFDGLERLENRGLVSLANGFAGDHLVLDGTLHGADGGALVVDFDVVTGAVDQVQVGALSGTNVLELDLVGQGSLLGIDGVRVLTSGSAQDGDELVLSADSRTRGFIGLGLVFDGVDSWLLESDLADEAYLAGAVPGGLRDMWRQGVQAVSTHLDATAGDTEGSGAWLQVVGGDFDGSSTFSHAQGGRELAWFGSHQGVQAGAEFSAGHWRAGVTGGVGEARMDLGGGEETRIDGANAGVYARYANQGWYAGAVLRADRFDIDADWASIGLETQGEGSAVGLELEGGRRFEVSRVWIEPSLKLSWISLSLPTLDGASGDVQWEDDARLSGELGLAIGLSEGWKGLRPYASMSIGREFGGGDVTRYDMALDDVEVTEEGDRGFGRFAAGLAWTVGRVDLYGEVDGRTGDLEGAGARIGARVRF